MDDVYLPADALSQQDDVTVLEWKDSISHSKPNGYRTLPLVISVPVYFSSKKHAVSVEVQIRTITMDFWASLEHQLKYKHEISNQEDIVSRLKACADQIDNLDQNMLQIREQIDSCQDTPSREEQLMEKIQRLRKRFPWPLLLWNFSDTARAQQSCSPEHLCRSSLE